MTEKLTATKALVELKMLDKRINQSISQGTFCGVVRGDDQKTIDQRPVDALHKEIVSNRQSIKALIERRNAIKCALVKANAEAMVTVGKRKYTVAQAIERKTSIGYETMLLTAMKMQYGNAVKNIEMHNAKVEISLKKVIDELGDSKSLNKNDIETTIKTFRRMNECNLFDPINIKKAIDDMQVDIDEFTAEVDTALSVSNAGVILEID